MVRSLTPLHHAPNRYNNPDRDGRGGVQFVRRYYEWFAEAWRAGSEPECSDSARTMRAPSVPQNGLRPAPPATITARSSLSLELLHRANLRNVLANDRLDPAFQGGVGSRTPPARADHLHVRDAVVDVDEPDVSAVAADRRPDAVERRFDAPFESLRVT